jgi:hypothetical protein
VQESAEFSCRPQLQSWPANPMGGELLDRNK